MPKQVVFTIAYGDPKYHAAAVEMFRSVRASGYDKDCVLISDRDFTPPKDLKIDVQVTRMPDRLLLLKTELKGASGYDQILYIDTDCDVTAPADGAECPLNAVFDSAKTGIAIPTIPFKLCDDPFNQKHLTPEEKTELRARDGSVSDLKALSRSINTGVLAFRGDQWEAITNSWRDAWMRMRPPGAPTDPQRDQAVLQALVYRRLIQFDYMPMGMVGFPSKAFKRMTVLEEKKDENGVVTSLGTAILHNIGANRKVAK